MAATDARPVPRKNAAFRLYFAIRKNDGTLITSWTGADSEVSLDGAAFADCTNEATEIGTSGCGYIDFTAAEMNADSVVYKLTVTNTSALTVVFTLFPEESGDYRADAVMVSGSATTADYLEAMNGPGSFVGTATAGASSTITLATGISFGTNILARRMVEIISGTGAGQSRMVLSNTNATPSVVTVDTAWTTTPDATSVYRVYGHTGADVRLYQGSNVPVQANVTQWNSSAVATPDTAGFPKVTIKSGTGTGEISLTSGEGTWLKPTVAGRTLDVSAGGEAGIDWANVGSPTTVVGLTGTTISTSQVVASVTGAVGSVTGNVGGNVVGSVASVTAGVTVTTVNDKTGYSLATAPPTAAAIADAVWDEALSGHSTAGSAGLALSTASSGGVDPSVLADAIWDEALSGHSTAGTAGKALSDALADTAELQTDWANGGRLDLLIDSILADTNELQTDWVNGGRLDLLVDQAVADSTLARQIVGNKHTVTNNGNGTYTIAVRNDADSATVRTIVYTPATGARTAS